MAKQIGSVSVAIVGDNDDLEKKLKQSGKDVEKFDKKTQSKLKQNQKKWKEWAKQAKGSLGSIKQPLIATAKGVGGITAAIGTGAAAFLAFASSIAMSHRELETLSRQSNMSTSDFKALSFATGTVGVEADTLSGQLEDMRRKFAEFGKVGTGAFQDYADIMGMTKEEAQQLALEMANLSGDQALQKLINNMEAAEVPTSQMAFVLDSLGSDMDRLIPLFTANGAAVKSLTSDYKSLATALDNDDIEAFEDLARNMGIATDNFKVFLSEALAPLAPAFNEAAKSVAQFFKALTEESRQADEAEERLERINALINERTIGRGRGKQTVRDESAKAAADLLERNLELEKLINAEFVKATGSASRNNKKNKEAFIAKQEAAKSEIESNNVKLQQLTKESESAQKVLDVYRGIAEVQTESAGTGKPAESPLLKLTKEETDKYIAALRDRLGKTQENLRSAYDKELELLQHSVNNKSISEKEANQRRLELEQEYYDTKILISEGGEAVGESRRLSAESQRYEHLVEHLNTLGLAEDEYRKQKEALDEEHQKRATQIKLDGEAARAISGRSEESLREAYEAELMLIESLNLSKDEASAQRMDAERVFLEGMQLLRDEDAALSFEKQIERENAEFEQFKLALDNKKLEQETHDLLMEAEKARHEKAISDIQSKEEKARSKGNKDALKNLAAGMNTGSRKLFEIGKASALAMAAINAKESIVSAYAAGSEIGGPWVGAAYAAAAGVAQFANLSQIKSASFSGGGSPTSYSGGVPTVSASQPQQSQTNNTPTVQPRTVNITLVGETQSTDSVRELIERINEETGDGFTLNPN